MKRIDFVNELSTRLEIKRRDLIEKDAILHFILLDLLKDRFFSEKFTFKGGSVLSNASMDTSDSQKILTLLGEIKVISIASHRRK